jgi:hypothetical protein
VGNPAFLSSINFDNFVSSRYAEDRLLYLIVSFSNSNIISCVDRGSLQRIRFPIYKGRSRSRAAEAEAPASCSTVEPPSTFNKTVIHSSYIFTFTANTHKKSQYHQSALNISTGPGAHEETPVPSTAYPPFLLSSYCIFLILHDFDY